MIGPRSSGLRRCGAGLLHDRGGSTLVEFAFITPILISVLLVLTDQLYQAYATAVLSGAVQKAARDGTLQGNNSAVSNAALDAAVLGMIRGMAPTATAVSTRRSYPNFSEVATPEPFTDTNADGIRQTGECYTDLNGNGRWDSDPGVNGDGGASDVVLYTMTITYPRIFPAFAFIGGPSTATISSSTIFKNQPWADQSIPTPVTRCT
jgi:Flp pilus assembly protein TadG